MNTDAICVCTPPRDSPASSFPRRREPRGSITERSPWAPAFAGVTAGQMALQRGLHLLDDLRERGGIVIGDGGQHFAVDLDLGLLQPVDEAAVGEAVVAHRGVDALDPQAPEVALLVPTVAIGVLQRLLQPLLRRAKGGGGAATE